MSTDSKQIKERVDMLGKKLYAREQNRKRLLEELKEKHGISSPKQIDKKIEEINKSLNDLKSKRDKLIKEAEEIVNAIEN